MALPSIRRSGNPFEFGQAIHVGSIVDRQDEIRRLTSAGCNLERLFLIGPRRFGKTSILNVAQHQLEQEGAIVLKYDVEKFESTELLARALLAGAIRVLTGPVEKIGAMAGRQIRKFFGALRPEVNYDVIERNVTVSFGVERRPGASDLPLLTDVLDGIDALAKAKERTVVVVLDEFQHLVETGGIKAERQIRAAVQTHRHVSYLFAGSKTRLLTDMTSQHDRPFYRMGSALFLGPVPRPQFAEFICKGFERHGFRIAPAAVGRILDLAQDVPYSVQRLAHRCWDLMCAGGPAAPRWVTSEFVDQVSERIVLEEDPAYTQLWLSLTLIQKKALKAVVGTGGRQLLSKAVTSQYGVAPASMQKALKVLDDRGIIREEQSLGSVRFRLDDPLLATWLRLAQAN